MDITRNDIAACNGVGVNLNGVLNSIVSLNICQDTFGIQGCFRVEGYSSGLTFTGNRTNRNAGPGINFVNSTGSNVFVGNSFQDDSLFGVYYGNAEIVWNNPSSGTAGCQTFSGNNYLGAAGYANYVFNVIPGGIPPCASFYETPTGPSGIFAPTVASANSTITWSSNVITITTAAAHGLGTSGSMNITLAGVTPSGYNGSYVCTLTGTSTFTCPLASNPGTETVPGTYVAQYSQAVLQPSLSPTPNTAPGPYANDTAAQAAGVPAKAAYKDSNGFQRIQSGIAGINGNFSNLAIAGTTSVIRDAGNVGWTLGEGGPPIIVPSSGSMGNNGAITLTTALGSTYASCYLVLPANAISSGSVAGVYYSVMSSSTAGTVYNNLYTSGTPIIPASPTAFSTTGPGAYTQTTGSKTLISATLPANAMGVNGRVEGENAYSVNNSATAKILTVDIGGSNFAYDSLTTQSYPFTGAYRLQNTGSALSQIGFYPIYGNVYDAFRLSANTATSQTLHIVGQLNASTDYIVLESFSIKVYPN